MAEVAIVTRLSGDGEVRRGLQDINRAVEDIGQKAKGAFADGMASASTALKDLGQVGTGVFTDLSTLATGTATVLGGVFASGAAGVAAAYGALNTAVRQTADLGDQMAALSERTNMSTEKLTAYKFALEQSNSSIQYLSDGVRVLSTNLSKASQDSGRAAQALKAMQIDAVDAVSGSLRNVDEVMLDVADRFQRMEDGAGKSALAVALFGASGDKLIPFLNKGRDGINELTREAEKLGLVLSGDVANASSEFNNNLAALQASSGALTREWAKNLLPQLAEITTQMRLATVESGLFSGVLQGAREVFSAIFLGKSPTLGWKQDIEESKKQLADYEKQIMALGAKLREQGSLSTGDSNMLNTLTRAYNTLADNIKKASGAQEQYNSLSAKANEAAPDIEKRAKAVKDNTDEETRLFVEWMQTRIKLRQADVEDLRAWLQIQLETATEGSSRQIYLARELGKVEEEIRRDALAGLREQWAQEDKLAQWQKQTRQQEQRERREIADARARDAEEELAEINKTTYATQADKIGALEALRLKYFELGEEGAKAYDKIDKSIKNTRTDAEVAAERMKRVLGSATYDIVNVAQGAQAGFQRTFADILKGTQSVTDGMKSLWKNFVDASINEVARLGARTLTSILFGGQGQTAAGGGGGGGAGLLGGLFNGLGGLLGGGYGGGGSSGGIFDPILSGAGNLFSSLSGGVSNLGTGFAGMIQNLGLSTGSTGITEIGNSLNSFFGEGAGSSIGTVAPYLASIYQLTQGNYGGAALTAAGAAIGGPAGAVLGNVLGSALGIGGSKGYARTTGHDFQGVLTAQGFQGTIYGMAANGDESYRFALPEGWGAPIREQMGDILRDVLGANTTVQIPISYVADATDPFTDIRNYVRQTATYGRYIGAFATGGEGIVTQPSLMMVGERGPERFSVTPLAGGGGRGAPAVNVNVNGYSMIDAYSARMMAREMVKILARENRRFV